MVNKTAGVDIVLTKEEDIVEIKYLDIKDNNIFSTTGFKNNSIKQTTYGNEYIKKPANLSWFFYDLCYLYLIKGGL